MQLPEGGGLVAGIVQEFSYGYLVIGKGDAVPPDAVGLRIASGQKACP